MLTFVYPWLCLLAPIPLLTYWLLPPYQTRRRAIRVPFFQEVARLTGAKSRDDETITPRSLWRFLLLALCWLCITGALMRPQWVLPPLHQDQPARDLLLLVDLSGSMDNQDFSDTSGNKTSRLVAVKQVLGDFLARRKGDRIGLVVFGNSPFVLAPFTVDLDLARRLLGEMQVGMAGPRTAFGDAIGLGINLFGASTVSAKTIIALTDGNDTASAMPPEEAARVAHDKGIVIHTVAIGDPTAVGEEKLDEDALKQVSELTNGGFYRALDHAQLAQIYTRLDQVEARKIDTISFQPKRELFWLPLTAFCLLTMLAQVFRLVHWPRVHFAEAAS